MAVGNETAERSCTVHTQRHERGQPVISANPSSCVDFSWLRGLDLNQRPLGYEPFSNQDWSQRPTNNASQISASYVVAFGPLWLSLGATSWVIPG
jgi:hypothetical protein